jgi:hypothetical protein
MNLIIIECLDCNGFKFAVEEKDFNWISDEDNNDKVSEFCCPSCANQIWEKDTNILGEVVFQK